MAVDQAIEVDKARTVAFATKVGIGLTVLAGFVLRIWLVNAEVGAADSDVSVIGLMSRHFLDGEFAVFHWGQAYAGSHEAMLGALVFGVFGSSADALKMVTVVLSGVCALLIWQLGRTLLNNRVGVFAALLFWVWPGVFAWWSVKPGSDYFAALAFALGAALIMLRLRNETLKGLRWFIALGALVGLAWWGNPQTIAIILPTALWCLPMWFKNFKYAVVSGVVAAIAALPWIAYNVKNDWLSLDLPESGKSYFDRLHAMYEFALPMALGLRVPFTGEWLVPTFVYTLVLIGFGLLFLRNPSKARFLLLITAVMPFILAVSPLSGDLPRYLLWMSPFVALLIGYLIARFPTPVLGAILVGALALSVVQVNGMNTNLVTSPFAPDVHVPADLSDLHALLREQGVSTAFADYNIAYRVTFETREEIIVTPTYAVRHKPIDDQVRNSATPAYAFLTDAATVPRFMAYCEDQGVECRTAQKGKFTVIMPSMKLLPENMPGGWIAPA